MTGIKLLTTGSALPKKVMTNEDLSRLVDTSDEWITKRTGIKERRHCVDETHLSLAAAAAEQALSRAGVERDKIAACVVTTICADRITPSCACMLQKALGLPEETACFDLNAACAGFIYGLRTVQGFLTEERPYGLVVSSEVLSRLTDFTDRTTCVLFGDGAGAVLVKRCEGAAGLCACLGSRSDSEVLYIPAATDPAPSHIHMLGQAVFKFAVDIIPRCLGRVLEDAKLSLDEVDWVVMHQANERIIDHVVRHMGIPPEKCFKNVARYGNMSSACIPIALDELYTGGALRPGAKLLLVGFGGGLTWGGALIEVGEVQ